MQSLKHLPFQKLYMKRVQHVLQNKHGFHESNNIRHCAFVCPCLLGGQLSFSLVVVHSVVGDSGQLPAAVVLIVDVVCHVLQVLHVSSARRRTDF